MDGGLNLGLSSYKGGLFGNETYFIVEVCMHLYVVKVRLYTTAFAILGNVNSFYYKVLSVVLSDISNKTIFILFRTNSLNESHYLHSLLINGVFLESFLNFRKFCLTRDLDICGSLFYSSILSRVSYSQTFRQTNKSFCPQTLRKYNASLRTSLIYSSSLPAVC